MLEENFAGEKAFDTREITFKYAEDGVKKVTVNGDEVALKRTGKDSAAFPLNAGKTAPDGKVICTKFKAEADKDYEIKFYL